MNRRFQELRQLREADKRIRVNMLMESQKRAMVMRILRATPFKDPRIVRAMLRDPNPQTALLYKRMVNSQLMMTRRFQQQLANVRKKKKK